MVQGKKVLAIVMAGGEGSRLAPLTAQRSKPSVPFGSRHHIVDFVLSNLVNSEIASIYLLVQYKSQSLIEHVRTLWPSSPMLSQQFVSVVPPQMQNGKHWYEGTADAVYQNLHLIDQHQPDLVVVFGADHVYRMDIRQMIAFHLAQQADVTVASLPVPLAQSREFGILRVAPQHQVMAFQEKPAVCEPMAGRPDHALASMGNYVFDAAVLTQVLREAHARGETDFGHHILPRMTASHRVAAYDFSTNEVPGVTETEERGYWRDVGTLEAYFNVHFDMLCQSAKLKLQNRQWPIYGSVHQGEAAQVCGGVIEHASLGGGCMVGAARLSRVVLRRDVRVADDAQLEDCIVMDRSSIGTGAQVRRAIIDEDNHVPAGARIGFDLDEDRKRFHVSEGGIVVVARGQLR